MIDVRTGARRPSQRFCAAFIRTTVIRSTLALATLLFTQTYAWACFCTGPEPACSAYWQSSAVFRGRVVERTVIPGSPTAAGRENRWSHIRVRFLVLETLRGEPKQEIVEITADGSSRCEFPFQEGREYLVFTHANQATGELWTSSCSRTHEIAAAKEDADLAWMRALETAPPGANIYGRLRLPPGISLSGFSAVVRLQGFEKYDTVPDDQGRYAFPGVAPGKYLVTATMPSGFTTREPETVEVEAKGCAEVDWPVFYDSHVRGRVTDTSGRPLPGLLIQLQIGDNEHNRATGFSGAHLQTSDADGGFDFVRVPPGEYLVAANNLGPSPTRPYPRVYYPDKEVDTEAESIHLPPSTIIENINITLPNAWKAVVVHVRILLPGGAPAAGADISARDTDYLWSVDPITSVAGSDGRATLTVYEGRSYYLTAGVSSPNGAQQRCAGPLKFIANDGLQLDSITIEHNWGNCLAQLRPLFRPPRE